MYQEAGSADLNGIPWHQYPLPCPHTVVGIGLRSLLHLVAVLVLGRFMAVIACEGMRCGGAVIIRLAFDVGFRISVSHSATGNEWNALHNIEKMR
jgi:hypothetical protein